MTKGVPLVCAISILINITGFAVIVALHCNVGIRISNSKKVTLNRRAAITAKTVLIVAFPTNGKSDEVAKQVCIKESSVNPSLVENATTSNISDRRELQCYYKCYFENAGYMSAEGEILGEEMKAKIPKGPGNAIVGRAVDFCKTKRGKDGCETAFLTQKCLLANNVNV